MDANVAADNGLTKNEVASLHIDTLQPYKSRNANPAGVKRDATARNKINVNARGTPQAGHRGNIPFCDKGPAARRVVCDQRPRDVDGAVNPR